MYLTHIVRALRDSLDGELLQRHLLHDNLLQGLDGSIDRTITRGSSLELLTRDVESDRGDALHTLTCSNLQEFKLHSMSLSSIGTCEHQHIGIVDLLLLVGQLEELLVYLIELLLRELYAIDAQTILQSSTSRTGCQYD